MCSDLGVYRLALFKYLHDGRVGLVSSRIDPDDNIHMTRVGQRVARKLIQTQQTRSLSTASASRRHHHLPFFRSCSAIFHRLTDLATLTCYSCLKQLLNVRWFWNKFAPSNLQSLDGKIKDLCYSRINARLDLELAKGHRPLFFFVDDARILCGSHA